MDEKELPSWKYAGLGPAPETLILSSAHLSGPGKEGVNITLHHSGMQDAYCEFSPGTAGLIGRRILHLAASCDEESSADSFPDEPIVASSEDICDLAAVRISDLNRTVHCSTIICGLRRSCSTSSVSTVLLIAYLRRSESDSRLAFHVLGGPTGFESFILERPVVDRMLVEGWWGCAGTWGRWDSLFIPAEQMRRAFTDLGIMPSVTDDVKKGDGK